jgi:hypothetical protein
MNKNGTKRLVCLGIATALLAGCGGTVQERLGFGKRSPDEFQVVRRAPLTVPPDLRTLPPPQPGIARPQEGTTAEGARAVLIGPRTAAIDEPAVAPGGGNSPARPAAASSAEQALLGTIPVQADPQIRRVLLEESTQLAQIDDRTYLFILDFQRRRRERALIAAETIDPVAEAQRLREEGIVRTTRLGSTPITGSGS